MVVMLSKSENSTDRQIAEILKSYGADIMLDSMIFERSGSFTVLSRHKPCAISMYEGVVIITDNIDNFKGQSLPVGVIGICSEENENALELFKVNNISVITCGCSSKNTLSVSSITDTGMLLSLQRSITDINGKKLEPCEIKADFSIDGELFPKLASVAALIIHGVSF